jgi:hypothetical protein
MTGKGGLARPARPHLGGLAMKLILEKHGGFAAGIRRPPLVVDSHSLPTAAAAELERLVAAARSAAPSVEEGPGKARDAMSYTISVDDADAPVAMTASDVDMHPAFADLLRWIETHAKTS